MRMPCPKGPRIGREGRVRRASGSRAQAAGVRRQNRSLQIRWLKARRLHPTNPSTRRPLPIEPIDLELQGRPLDAEIEQHDFAARQRSIRGFARHLGPCAGRHRTPAVRVVGTRDEVESEGHDARDGDEGGGGRGTQGPRPPALGELEAPEGLEAHTCEQVAGRRHQARPIGLRRLRGLREDSTQHSDAEPEEGQLRLRPAPADRGDDHADQEQAARNRIQHRHSRHVVTRVDVARDVEHQGVGQDVAAEELRPSFHLVSDVPELPDPHEERIRIVEPMDGDG